MAGLFSSGVYTPLADRMRPHNLSEIVGQTHLLGHGAPLFKMVQQKKLSSFILWGPPGCGKTTIAKALASSTNMHFEPISAVFAGVADLKKAFDMANSRRLGGQGTILFIDEIHRFNRAQQDSFLPVVENGTVVLIGATTENPSFELNNALLSRAKVFILKKLTDSDLETLYLRAEKVLQKSLPLDENGKDFLKNLSAGDGRYFINLLETVADLSSDSVLTVPELETLLQKKMPSYDKRQESHYNLISALHKSLRGSDPDAGLYWLARMILGGEDKKYILRRLLRFAAEDVGLADPEALKLALSAWQSYERLGSPEGDLVIAELVVYLALAPKSVSVYKAFNQVQEFARKYDNLMPPMHILNAPTKLMKEWGYNKGYQYDPDLEDSFSGQNYFPDGIPRPSFYQAVERGFERELKKRQDYFNNLRQKKCLQKKK